MGFRTARRVFRGVQGTFVDVIEHPHFNLTGLDTLCSPNFVSKRNRHSASLRYLQIFDVLGVPF